jgi:hypothetical protein
MDYLDESDLVNMFKKQIDLERELEMSKQDLATRYDFNLYDAYDQFNDFGKGYLNSTDIDRALNRFRIYPYRDEATLLIKHYSKGDIRLLPTAFNDIFLPKDGYYADMLRARLSERRRVFSFETETRIQRLM